MIKNPYLFEKRSIVEGKKDTTISMEGIYWAIIEKIARRHRTNWRTLVNSILYHQPPSYKSRAGWLRAYVAKYAYVFLTRPDETHNPPKHLMKWSHEHQEFRFPTSVSKVFYPY